MASIIAIAGMPGSGKSSTGKKLAALLSCKWVDLDLEVERRAGKSIARIFAEDGEPAFRRMEKTVLARIIRDFSTSPEMTKETSPEMTKEASFKMEEEASFKMTERGSLSFRPSAASGEISIKESYLKNVQLVISLGGGTLMDQENLKLVKAKTECIWLDVPVEELTERLWTEKDSRPLLAGAKTKEELRALLQTLYEQRRPK